MLFLGGAAIVVVIALVGLFLLLSAGSSRSTNVDASGNQITTTTRKGGGGPTTTAAGGETPSSEAPATTEAPTTTAGSTGGGGGAVTPTTTAPATTTTLPPGVKPLVQVAPRSGEQLVIPNNSDPNNVNPGVTAGQIKIRNLGSSPGQFFVTFPTGTPQDILKALRLQVLQPTPGSPGTLPGGGEASVIIILKANPVNDQGTPIGPAKPGDTGTVIIRGLGPDIPISYVVGS